MIVDRDRPEGGWFTPPEPDRPFGAPPPAEPVTPSSTRSRSTPEPPRARPGHSPSRAVPGSPGARLVARLIDGFCVGALSVLLALPLWLAFWRRFVDLVERSQDATVRPTPDAATTRLWFFCILVQIAVFFVYELVQTATWGTTFGKWALGLAVIDPATGSTPSWNRAAARAAVLTLPPIVPTAGALFTLVDCSRLLWDRPLRRCFHDSVARTLVIRR